MFLLPERVAARIVAAAKRTPLRPEDLCPFSLISLFLLVLLTVSEFKFMISFGITAALAVPDPRNLVTYRLCAHRVVLLLVATSVHGDPTPNLRYGS